MDWPVHMKFQDKLTGKSRSVVEHLDLRALKFVGHLIFFISGRDSECRKVGREGIGVYRKKSLAGSCKVTVNLSG